MVAGTGREHAPGVAPCWTTGSGVCSLPLRGRVGGWGNDKERENEAAVPIKKENADD